MKDVDRSKEYDSGKNIPEKPAPDPSDAKKQLLVLQSRLEQASGDDQVRLQKEIDEITQRLKKEGQLPPSA